MPEVVIARYDIGPKDHLFGGVKQRHQPVIIEMAQLAGPKAPGLWASRPFGYRQKPSRHKDGLHLPDVCDLCIDNHVPVGDASVAVQRRYQGGAGISIASLAIADAVVLAACQELRLRGIDPRCSAAGTATEAMRTTGGCFGALAHGCAACKEGAVNGKTVLILERLLDGRPHKLRDLAQRLEISVRLVRYEMQEVDAFLRREGFPALQYERPAGCALC